jgi:hypothetical protein
MEYYSAIKEEGNFIICHSIDEHKEHCARGNKSDTKRQILYDLTYEEFKKLKLMQINSRLSVAKGWGRGWGSGIHCPKGTNF